MSAVSETLSSLDNPNIQNIRKLDAALKNFSVSNKNQDFSALIKPFIDKFGSDTDYLKEIIFEISNGFGEINPEIIMIINALMADLEFDANNHLLKTKIKKLIEALEIRFKAEISKLALFYAVRPYHSLDDLLTKLESRTNIDVICDKSKINFVGNRSAQFKFAANTQIAEDENLKRYKTYIENPAANVKNLVNFFVNINNSKQPATKARNNILAYQQLSSEDLFKKAKLFVENSLKRYLKIFNLGDDRIKCVNTVINDLLPVSSNFIQLIDNLNIARLSSFGTDCTKNKSWFFPKHRGASRFRDQVLFNIKMGIYSLAAPNQLLEIAKQELINLKDYLKYNLDNNVCYTNNSDVKSLLSKLVNELPGLVDQPVFTLAKAVAGLNRLINHSDYADKVSGLREISNSLSYLYSRAKNIEALKNNQYQQAYKSVSKLLNKIDIKSPSMLCMFSNTYYHIPANQNVFPEILNNIVNLKEKYFLHEIMKRVKTRLEEKYHADRIEFDYKDAKLSVKFGLKDEQTSVVTSNEIAIYIDIKNKKYIPEPIVTTPVLSQSAYNLRK